MEDIKLPADYNKLKGKQRRKVREQYVEMQNGKCFYCNEDLNLKPPERITKKEINWNLFPPGFLKNPIHLQHDHRTGLTEGAVHAYCNAVMWQYDYR